MSRVDTFCKTSALEQEYKAKLVTADEAVKIIKSGDRVHYGLFGGLVRELDKALAKRTEELHDVKVCTTIWNIPNLRRFFRQIRRRSILNIFPPI